MNGSYKPLKTLNMVMDLSPNVHYIVKGGVQFTGKDKFKFPENVIFNNKHKWAACMFNVGINTKICSTISYRYLVSNIFNNYGINMFIINAKSDYFSKDVFLDRLEAFGELRVLFQQYRPDTNELKCRLPFLGYSQGVRPLESLSSLSQAACLKLILLVQKLELSSEN